MAPQLDPEKTSPVKSALDGNEAAARIAYKLSQMIAIYPITPASPMGEAADAWAAEGRSNIWGDVPSIVEMQSEAGAAGAIHGALTSGVAATTFTASQGLLLMVPNMFKIAGELSPAVIHVAARTVATHALSIFGDHSDVMAVRATGWAMLASASVQEAQDLALVAHAASLRSRIPFLHFFDGFRTSHEVNKIELLQDADLEAMIDSDALRAQRDRGLSPDHPSLRGSAQNPDVFFQAREAANRYYDAAPGIVQACMDELGARTGRSYSLMDYVGAPDADRVIVMMGSGTGAAEEAIARLTAAGERVGLVKVRLFRPFPSDQLRAALPATVRTIAVLDRTKEPGAVGEPLYQDVVTALAGPEMPRVFGGRYGLSSKEFTPSMVKAILDEAARSDPKQHFTVGIVDDVTHSSLQHDPSFSTEKATVRAVFYGLGSDGTVGANKATVKIVNEETDLFAQGYFVYDSKKSGSMTVSHLRFSSDPIHSTYLIDRANFLACHQFGLLRRVDVLKCAERGATLLLNAPFPAERVWVQLPAVVKRQILEKDLRVHVIDAYQVAQGLGLGGHINTVMQPCFFALTNVLPLEQAKAAMKLSIEKTYGHRGADVVKRNHAAIDRALGAMYPLEIPEGSHVDDDEPTAAFEGAPDFVGRVTARMMAGEGDLLPVSALPIDGTFLTGSARWEKRDIASEIPIWDPDLCIDCGHCTIVCPHAALRMKVYDPDALQGAPQGFRSKDFHSKELDGMTLSIQVAPMDCTGCKLCVEACPVLDKKDRRRKALNMEPIDGHRDVEEAAFGFFLDLPQLDPTAMSPSTVKGSQVREPLFEFPGACAGCGETPYLKLLSQLFGDRVLVANATGCSSIYGGNLPTTPWTKDGAGRGPAWANSLFEDNAEFGLGIRLAQKGRVATACRLLQELAPELDAELLHSLLTADQSDDEGVALQRIRVEELKVALEDVRSPAARELQGSADMLVDKAVWIVGGDGWAYDIGFGGLDHVLASGENVNVLVLDTEVYSNTGGQASKSTPRAAVARFAAKGKRTRKKDLGAIAMGYGDVYVAQVALGADYKQTIKALLEAEAWPGPSLVIAYSTCIEHGIDMGTSMTHQKEAVKTGYWPLYRFRPGAAAHEHPLKLDSKAPSAPVRAFLENEGRFTRLIAKAPEEAETLLALAQEDVSERWRYYEQLAGVERSIPDGEREPAEL
jgi:pyruvate-ferredoxin/flavodoxin oxidoreductase